MAQKNPLHQKQEKFAGIPVRVMETRKYANLGAWAVRLLLEFARQYKGQKFGNNGDLSCAWSDMKERGWHSKGTLSRAVRELQEAGFIVRTRMGWKNRCALYAITWQPIDECIDRKTQRSKLEEMNPTVVAPGTWKDPEPEREAA